VVQGERELVKDCRSLAQFSLRGIPPMVAGAARIRVTFQVDADGLVSVVAQELTSGVVAQVDVKPSYGLTDAEIATMLQASFTYAKDDAAARVLAEARTDAQRLIEAVQAAMAVDADLLSATERALILQEIERLHRRQSEGDASAIKAAIEKLSTATETFAAKRMDKSVAKALTGKSLDEIAKIGP
jgi:molecular chaperone HscA